jgi:type IV pilus assembly protein PilB
MEISIDTLKKVLVESGYISEADFNEAVESSQDLGKRIEDVLVFRGLISEDVFGKLISEHLKIPHANIKHVIIPEDILTLIPEKMARSYKMVAFGKGDGNLKLAMLNPQDFEALEFAKRQTGLQILPHYANREAIRRALGQYKRNIRADFDKIISENVKKTSVGPDLAKAAEELPVIKILDTILEYAVAERASDIHIETLSEEVIVRYRVDGVLTDIIKLTRGIEIALIARIKILSNLKIDEHRVPQDGRYRVMIDDDVVAIRVSIIPSFYGENVVMRLLPETSRMLSLEELGMSGHALKLVKSNITKPHGMLLVTGPTGSGKTTTLYTIINVLNTIKVKICAIEDPIEYGIKRVSQIQVNQKAGLDFASGLRALLRHDPDIIMVGEIRDNETAAIAVHAALTGHLMLSTLHTNDAVGSIPRLLDMGVEEYLLASTLNLVIAQRLVRRICQACLEEYKPDDKTLEKFTKDMRIDFQKQKFYRGKGCEECHGIGYSGRVGIYEVLSVTEALRDLITKRTARDDLIKQGKIDGMVTMLEDGLNKISAGSTTVEEVLRAVRED